MTDITFSAPGVISGEAAAKSDGTAVRARYNFTRLFTCIGDAFRLAYVAPYASNSQPLMTPEAHLDGRDPRW